MNQTGGLVQTPRLDLFCAIGGTLGTNAYNLSGGTLDVTYDTAGGGGRLGTGEMGHGGVNTSYPGLANFNFTGGSLKVLSIDASMPSLVQSATSGNSLLDVTGNSTIISVNYTAASASNTATISIGSGYSLTMSNNSTLTIGNGGVLTVAGTATGASGTSLTLTNLGEGLVVGNGGLVSFRRSI